MGSVYPYMDKLPKIDDTVFVAPGAVVAGDVEIGAGSSVWFNAVLRGDLAKIKIGKGSNVQDNAVIHAMQKKDMEIGDNVTIGHNALVHCSKIGSNTLIGMGSNILGMTEIGDFCLIGANTLLTRGQKIPDYSLVYGNPGRIIRRLREDEIEALKYAADGHVKLAENYAKSLAEEAK